MSSTIVRKFLAQDQVKAQDSSEAALYSKHARKRNEDDKDDDDNGDGEQVSK